MQARYQGFQFGLAVALLGCGVPAGDSGVMTREEQLNRDGLRKIGLAMLNYQDLMGSFPPAEHSTDGFGLSWRVHLLEVLRKGHAGWRDARRLHDGINRDESWDSEVNQRFVSQIPELYHAAGQQLELGQTTFHVFVGNGAPFGEKYGPKLAEITDGTSRTVMVVLAGPETATEWTRPGGLKFNPDAPTSVLGTLPEDGFIVVLFDSSVWRLPRDLASRTLMALITHQGGEDVDPAQIDGAVRLTGGDPADEIEPNPGTRTRQAP